MKRRSFLKTVGTVAGTYALGSRSGLGQSPSDTKKETVAGLPRRVLGRTGERISVVGFPGLALTNYEQQEGTAGVHRAFEQGLNYFDVAPAYGKGEAEVKMGIALQGIDRDKIFLANKTKMRDKKGALEELERSLKRLKTDYFDLYQMHCLFEPQEMEKALGPDGAIETFVKAKEQGKIKHLGFSAHTTRSALAALKGYSFDTVMFPLSFVEYYQFDFGTAVLDLAAEQGLGVLAIKHMSKGGWPKGAERKRKWWYQATEKQQEANMALNFALSLKGVVSCIPPSFIDLTEIAMKAGRVHRPITEAETQTLQTMAQTGISLFRRRDEQLAVTEPIEHPAYLPAVC